MAPVTPVSASNARDNLGNPVYQALYPTGLTDGQGNTLYQLGTAARPTEVGALGSYSVSVLTGTVGAGLGAGSIVYAFRWAPATSGALALIKRVAVAVNSLGTGFTAGVGLLSLFVARSFSANDTGGTAVAFTTGGNKFRTSFGPPQVANVQIANTGAMAAGTRTPDTNALAQVIFAVNATANAVQLATTNLLGRDQSAGDWPLILANNEGFEIQATVPATGTWQGQVQVEWLEVPTF